MPGCRYKKLLLLASDSSCLWIVDLRAGVDPGALALLTSFALGRSLAFGWSLAFGRPHWGGWVRGKTSRTPYVEECGFRREGINPDMHRLSALADNRWLPPFFHCLEHEVVERDHRAGRQIREFVRRIKLNYTGAARNKVGTFHYFSGLHIEVERVREDPTVVMRELSARLTESFLSFLHHFWWTHL